MGFGVSITLAAVGAILRWAVTVNTTHGFNIHTVGLILLIVGIVGFISSAIYWRSWGGYTRRRVVTDRPVTYQERPRY